MSLRHLNSDIIKAEAKRLGFFACGIAKAEPVDNETAERYKHWISVGGNATMDYMNNNIDKRLNPQLLMPGLKSIVCFAINYAPSQTIPQEKLQLAYYAYGKDYHNVVKQKLRQLADLLNIKVVNGEAEAEQLYNNDLAYCNKENQSVANDDLAYCRIFCDSAPVLERYWASRAGLGWIGRNQQLIIPHAGSMFFLAEMFLNVDLTPDAPIPNRCGTCHKCIDSCPTQALPASSDGLYCMMAERCLSYQTIENRGELSPLAQETMGRNFYGCDKCQLACPWNRFTTPSDIKEFNPKPQLLEMADLDWANLSEEQFRELFRESAVKRVKYQGLMRNIRASLKEQ